MKFNKNISSSRRKQRKAHFTANPSERRIRMSSTLSKELRTKYGFRSFPIRTNDKVTVIAGKFKNKSGTVVQVRRKDYKVYVDCCEGLRRNGKKKYIGIDASNLRIDEFYMEEGRDKIIEKKMN
ncbi:60S ribosomal L26 [Tubulinosema ratisbonensis]|uniref:60S ribosomal L26 n=1 Tax=Tubulinosema ratisbonensis TaxID=291195 RepID=A0A437ANY3_9MICR|nr:60S ribosomal L26 [Tubulinosema ratisbonensis]